MLFDYLVAILAQKIDLVSLLEIGKIEKFSKIQILAIFSNFKETYKSECLSYDCDQVVKKHLNYSNNSYGRARSCTRAARQNGKLKKIGFSNIFVMQLGGSAVSGRATARAPT